jgi:2-methylcitrate dehydratase
MSNNVEVNVRPDPDALLVEIADYVSKQEINSELALSTARGNQCCEPQH